MSTTYVSTRCQFYQDSPSSKAKAILVKADQVADALSLDEELLDGLVVGLNL